MSATPAPAISPLDEELQESLDSLQARGLHRALRQFEGRPGPRMTVDGREVLMLSSANYLDLAADPRIIEAAAEATREGGCAAGGARLICGNLPLHENLEASLASFLGQEAALLFSTGYMANLGVLTALAGEGDLIVSDELNHASVIDACRLSGAEVRTFRHNDVDDFRSVAKQAAEFRRRLLVVDGVFSMDGDTSPLDSLVPVAREFGLTVVVDDAHGIGVLGQEGRGTVESLNAEADVVIGNLGKAFGSFGAFVACSRITREYLVNCSRSFIFTCGLPPASAAAALVALDLIQKEPDRRAAVLARAEQLRSGLREIGYDTGPGKTQIVPAIVGDNDRALDLTRRALDRGVYAQAIRYPSVPEGTARLRFTPTAGHTAEDIDRVVDLFDELR